MAVRKSNLPLIGGLLAAVGAGLCCAGPLVLLLLGISGAWIGKLTLLEPYRPFFILLVLALFGLAGARLYRPIQRCAPDSACAVPTIRRSRQVIFWISTTLALLLVTSNYWIIAFA